MLMILSKGKYPDLLDLYDSNLEQSGLPASSYPLEMATQARAKLPDDARTPGDYIDVATEAGMKYFSCSYYAAPAHDVSLCFRPVMVCWTTKGSNRSKLGSVTSSSEKR
jgi:hypothetical protein